MQYLLEKLNVLKEYKKTLDFLCRFTIMLRLIFEWTENDIICDIIIHIYHCGLKRGEGIKMTIDELLQKPYWIIDILPEQVPADSPGQFFAIEKFFLGKKHMAAIKQKHVNLVLKLNCYRRIAIDEEYEWNPSPERIAEEMRARYLYIMMDDSMILSEPDDSHMTVFDPDEKLLELIRTLAASEGLFVWQPPQ